MLDLFLVRHGETEWSRSGRHTGRTDLPLLPEGEERARTLRPRLAGEPFAIVYTSPLQRARRTAELAGFLDPISEPLLQEWDYGDYEGITSDQIHRQRPGWNLWTDGCPNGEMPGQVRERATRFLQLLAGEEQGTVVAFSHGHFLRMLAVAFLELPTASGSHLNLETAAISVLRLDRPHRLLQLWNDTGHLPGTAS